jgi:hypothetical protein
MRTRGFLFCLAALPVFAGALRTPSPQGNFEVAFELDPSNSMKGWKSLRYKVSFYKPGLLTETATTDFYDVSPSSTVMRPTPAADLARRLLWSPREDFVILPPESWPDEAAKKDPALQKRWRRTAVSLNPAYPWQTAPFLLEEKSLVWMDSLQVAGNWRDGCRVAVGAFDARTGKTNPLTDALPPWGYEILSATEKTILMKKVLSPCATPEDARFFVPDCTVYNLSFKRREIGSCPP